MKTLIVSLVALLFAFFVGCQSSITDPVDSENNFGSVFTQNVADKDFISFLPGVLEIKGTVKDPRLGFNSIVNITGVIRYDIKTIYFDSPPPAPQEAFKVQLHTDVQLVTTCSQDDDIWTVKSDTEDLIYKTNQSKEKVYYLKKSFRVNSVCPVPKHLVFKFEVTSKELKLVSMNLITPDGWVSAGDPGT